MIELLLKSADHRGIACDDQVFVVVGACGARPVEAAVEEEGLVEDGEFVVHVIAGLIDSDGDSSLVEVDHIGAEVGGFVVVGDDTDGEAALVGFFEDAGEAVVRDGVDADIEGLSGALEDFKKAGVGSSIREEQGFVGVGGLGGGLLKEDLGERGDPFEGKAILGMADGCLCASKDLVAQKLELFGGGLGVFEELLEDGGFVAGELLVVETLLEKGAELLDIHLGPRGGERLDKKTEGGCREARWKSMMREGGNGGKG